MPTSPRMRKVLVIAGCAAITSLIRDLLVHPAARAAAVGLGAAICGLLLASAFQAPDK